MKPLLLCGASVRSLARSAVRAGWEPWCVDFFADVDLTDFLTTCGGRFVGAIQSFDQIPNVVSAISPQVPLVWCGGLENYPAVLSQLGLQRTVFGASAASIRRSRDLPFLQQNLGGEGYLLPRTTWFTDQFGRLESSSTHWLIKSKVSSGGLGVRRQTRKSDIAHPTGDPFPPGFNSRHYVQEFIAGTPMSAIFLAAHHDAILIGCSLQLTGLTSVNADEFQFCGNLGPVHLPSRIVEHISSLGRKVQQLTGLHGVFGIDFMLRDGEVWLLEINPRLTASHEIYEWQRNLNLLAEHIESCIEASSQTRNHSVPKESARTFIPQHPTQPTMLRLIIYQSKLATPNAANLAAHAVNADSRGDKVDQQITHQHIEAWMADLPMPPDCVEHSASPPVRGIPLCSLYLSGVSRDYKSGQPDNSGNASSATHQSTCHLIRMILDGSQRLGQPLRNLGIDVAVVSSELVGLIEDFKQNAGAT